MSVRIIVVSSIIQPWSSEQCSMCGACAKLSQIPNLCLCIGLMKNTLGKVWVIIYYGFIIDILNYRIDVNRVKKNNHA